LATNTTKSMKEATVNESDLKHELERAKAAFKDEKLVKVKIPPIYKKVFGEGTVPVGLNFITVNLPVDGSEHSVPESFAKRLDECLNEQNLD
jgi:hypothetical protein